MPISCLLRLLTHPDGDVPTVPHTVPARSPVRRVGGSVALGGFTKDSGVFEEHGEARDASGMTTARLKGTGAN